MDSSQLLASVAVALDKLQYRMKPSIGRFDDMVLRIMILGLRAVRTFLLCSTLLTEDNNDTEEQKQDNRRMREDLGSLLVRVGDVVRKISDDHTLYQPFYFHHGMESCEAEMDNWYTIFSAYLKKDSTSLLANQIKAILDSVNENLEDYLIFKRRHGFDLEEQLQQIEELKEYMTLMKHIICFSALFCTENQEVQCPLTNIEPLAISAAHFTLHLFSNIKGPNDTTSSMLSALLLKINHACNPHLYVTSSFSTQIKRCLSCNKQLQNPVIALQLPGISYIKMDSSRLLDSIVVALEKLQSRRKQSLWHSYKLTVMIRGLRVFRTFLLCSTQSTEENSFTPCSPKEKQDISRMREDLGSLLIRVEDVVRKILDDPTESCDCQYDMESCEDAMDSWYTSFSAYLKKYSTSPLTNQIKAILDSVLENLKDYLIIEEIDEFELLEQIETLEGNIRVMRRIICFGTLLCTENQEFQCLLTHIHPCAISAAHLTLRLFGVKGPRHLPRDVITFTVSTLMLKINHAVNTLLHEKYTLALASLKHSRENVKMESCIVSLSCDLWEMLQSRGMISGRVSLKELELHDRLGMLRILIKRQPDIFGDDKIWDLTAATVYGLSKIFSKRSICQKDLANDQSFQDNGKVNWVEVLEEKVAETSRLNFCKTNVLGFIDFLLKDYLLEVNSSEVDSNTLSCVPIIREHLVLLKSIMGKLAKLLNQHEDLNQHVWILGVAMAYKMEFLIDQLVLGDVLDSFSMSLQSITENIMTIKSKIKNDEAQQITCPSADKATMVDSLVLNMMKWSINSSDEVVGFESEKKSIVNRLVAGVQKLQVVAVVGMAGLGKTTLATKVYGDSYVTHHFRVQARCSISQVFDRRKVLLELLNQIKPEGSNSATDENDLSEKLRKSLKQRRYLIFVDDVWDTEAFDLLKGSLPDDKNGSRILLTSRHSDVVGGDILNETPLFLRHLTVDESLELLRRKLFPDQKNWPSESIHKFAMEVAELCKGLPLTVVIVAGLLRTTDQEGWKDILKTLRSSIYEVTDQCESTIALSYKHLPDHLKPCFLWFGAFPEDHEFSVKRMIGLWISEGLVRKNESKSSEDVARDYLNNLIARSLVMNGERRSVGGVKTCRIHDLLHDFCKRKANEECFLHVLEGDHGSKEEVESSGEYETLLIDEVENLYCVELRNLRRLCIYSNPESLKWKVFCPRLRSLLFFLSLRRYQELDLSYIFRMFKLLRVLDIHEVYLYDFPSEIGALVQLRYLAIHLYWKDTDVGPAIGNLSNLETLILFTEQGVVSLPDTFWNLRKLRHLYSTGYGSIELPIDDSNSSCKLLELQTLSTLAVRYLSWSVLEKQLRKIPKICRLKCRLEFDFMDDSSVDDSCVDDSKVIDLSFLSQLQSFSLYRFHPQSLSLCRSHPLEWVFPENIKKLTLWNTEYPWDGIVSIAYLPNLEVLKLHWRSFVGNTWHVEEGEFPKLKVLKLAYLDLVNWTTASDDLFPNLEKLMLEECLHLEEIPAECLENVATLQTIEVISCAPAVVSQAKKVYETQEELGNSALMFHERGKFRSAVNGNDVTSDEELSGDE